MTREASATLMPFTRHSPLVTRHFFPKTTSSFPTVDPYPAAQPNRCDHEVKNAAHA